MNRLIQTTTTQSLKREDVDTFLVNEDIGQESTDSQFLFGLKQTKIGNHVAFSKTRPALGMSPPGAPNKIMRQLSRSNRIFFPSHRVQGLRIRGGDVGVGGQQPILWCVLLYMQGNLRHSTQGG
jgi:hypothetical protein